MNRIPHAHREPAPLPRWRLVAEAICFLLVCFAVVAVLSLEAVA